MEFDFHHVVAVDVEMRFIPDGSQEFPHGFPLLTFTFHRQYGGKKDLEEVKLNLYIPSFSNEQGAQFEIVSKGSFPLFLGRTGPTDTLLGWLQKKAESAKNMVPKK